MVKLKNLKIGNQNAKLKKKANLSIFQEEFRNTFKIS